jgi:hypothetical protein
MRGFIYVFFYALVFAIFFFGVVQFNPKSTHDLTCTYTVRSFLQNRFVRINYSLLHKTCH